MEERPAIFLISDRTGITIEKLVHTLLTQFDNATTDAHFRAFQDTPEKISKLVDEIDTFAEREGVAPLVFSSVVDESLRKQLKQAKTEIVDIFDIFLPNLSTALHKPMNQNVGKAHGMGTESEYERRVEAVNYALSYDDGARIKGLDKADLILMGVSRSGKTPTCLYLAMQYKVLAANYPLTEDDFMEGRLPEPLKPFKEKLFGLSITPERLHQIREERRPGSKYASIDQCRREITAAESLYRQQGIKFVDSTAVSIEELAIAVMQQIGMKRGV